MSESPATMMESFNARSSCPDGHLRVAVCASGRSVRCAADHVSHDDRLDVEAPVPDGQHIDSAVGDRSAAGVTDPSTGYIENAMTLVEGRDGFEWGERLDPTWVA